jgi:hypothetical protein
VTKNKRNDLIAIVVAVVAAAVVQVARAARIAVATRPGLNLPNQLMEIREGIIVLVGRAEAGKEIISNPNNE